MPKPNVNAATREELVEVAGLRPDVADAVLEFRGKHGKITDVEALDELRGVGPATLEQLRTTLDFSDKREKAGNGNGSDKVGKEAAERTAEVISTAARGGAEAARSAVKVGTEATSTMASSGLEVAQRTAGAMGEVQRETMRQSAEGTAELGRLFVELLNEQTRHNLQVVTAFGRAVNWDEIIQVQSDLVRASFERMNRLNGRYLEIFQGMMRVTASAAKDQAKKAA